MKSFTRKLYFLIVLIRPINVLITFISVFIGAWVGGIIHPLEKLLYACLSAALICGGGNVLNDFFDAESDKINKPHRPIPSGLISKSDALILWILLSGIGFLSSFFISSNGVVIAATALVLLFLYNSFLKNTILIGNILISSITGLAFIYGGVSVGNINGALIPAVFAFLFHLGREVIKDTEDIEGDTRAGLQTFSIKYGVRNSFYLVSVIFFILFAATFYPYFFLDYSTLYLIIVILGVDLIIFYSLYSLLKNSEKSNLRRVNRILKGDMVIGLIALLLR